MNTERPNIVFILSDDQGMWSMGCAGNDEIITPNMDRLANEGMLFNNFFLCIPCLLTCKGFFTDRKNSLSTWST